MAPLLFLFIMQAVIQSNEDILPTNKPEFRFFPNDKGRLTGQRMKSTGTPFNTPNLLYIDDGAFIFQSLKDTKKASQIIFNHKNNDERKETPKSNIGISSKSKTEAMYFPPSLKEAQENEAPTKKLLLNDGTNGTPFIKKYLILWCHHHPRTK